jgi:4-hydroxybenzoate polyprenyltransferase
MVLNDFADRREDAVRRPERPLPRGEIRPGAALALGLALIGAALVLVPARGLPFLIVMIAAVLAYDFGAKRSTLTGAMLLGVLRAFNLTLGAFALAAPAVTLEPHALEAPLIAYFAYICFLTMLAAHEEERIPRAAMVVLHAIPALAMVVLALWLPVPVPALALALLFAAAVALSLRAALRSSEPRVARASVTMLLIGILVFDAVVCAGHGRYLVAATVLAFVPIARWISRRVAMT